MPVWIGWVGFAMGGLCAIGSGLLGILVAVRLIDDYRSHRHLHQCEHAELLLHRQVAAIAAIEENLCADPFEELDREWCKNLEIQW